MAKANIHAAADRFMSREGLMLSSPLGLRIPRDRRVALEMRIRTAFEAGFREASAIRGGRASNLSSSGGGN